MTVSSRSNHCARSIPAGASSANSMMPLLSSARPSSEPEHSMPNDSTPRSLAFLSLVPSGSRPPTRAKAEVSPSRALGAPHTTCTVSASPASTSQTRSLSASGCGATLAILPTTTFSKAGRADSRASTSSPNEVRFSASVSLSTAGLIQLRNQDSLTFMRPLHWCETATKSADRCQRTA